MSALEDITTHFNSVHIPETMHVQDPEDPIVFATRDEYFEHIQKALKLSHLVLSDTLTVASDEHIKSSITGPQYNYHLWFGNTQKLASMVRHDQPNGLQAVRYIKHPLKPKVVREIHNYHEADDALTRILFKQ